MAVFITPSMFVGKYKLNTGMYSTTDIQAYIDKYEQQYLVQLLGADLYDELISDLNLTVTPPIPKSPNFIKIFAPFYENVSIFQLLYSEGIIDMLKGFIYWEYSKDLLTTMTIAGEVSQNAENSAKVSALNSGMWDRYNTSVKTHNTIQKYIRLNWDQGEGQIVSFYSNVFVNGTGYYTSTQNCILLSGLATAINIQNQGSGYTDGVYTNQPTTTNGSGTGLTVSYTISGGQLTALSIGVGGSGYKYGDFIYFAGAGTGAYGMITGAYQISSGTGTAVVDIVAQTVGSILTHTITSAGTGYSNNAQNIGLAGGTGNGATCDFTVNQSGGVTGVTIVNKGAGYSVGDTLTISTYTQDATITINTVGNGQILSFTINSLTPKNTMNYKINDILEIQGTNGTKARIRVNYVGIGDYHSLDGIEKLYGNWI